MGLQTRFIILFESFRRVAARFGAIAIAFGFAANLPIPLSGQWIACNDGIVTCTNSPVGIGTGSPAYPLDVNGSSRVESNNYSGVTFQQQPYPNQGSLLFSSDRTGYTFMIGNQRTSDGTVLPIMTMYDYGNVGIGTTTPQHLLQVAGTIGAEEVIVSATGADYVFEPEYRLAPLGEVAVYIKANHHLPEIPSAAEVLEKGVSLGEMQSKLLAKIEELTLHMIQAERENQELRERVVRLEHETAQK